MTLKDASGRSTAVCIAGPTASGKTALALALADRYPVEIISVDSAQVYTQMDIGTAKPDAAIRRRVPHHLIDIRDPWERYSAGDFCDDAHELIPRLIAAGKLPLFVGGTLLYFRALQQGLDALPRADPQLRERIDAEAATHGWAALHAELQRVDSAAAARIGPRDRQRIQRALEVYRLTGQPISTLQTGPARRPACQFLSFALMPTDRRWLHERIAARFDAMVAAGFVDEVRRLQGLANMRDDLPAIRAVGYRQIWQHLRGDFDLDEAVQRAVTATRRYAKRQMTWLRSEPAFTPLECGPGITVQAQADAVSAVLGAGA
ncbi:MAG: tRNA (adenosine(37)-N6)-dimethylallyltransferase MiaA [Gammaproteobacteria bacterium]|nr:tRNA (adenosine(37)-N6)-dimethylallyltransferase MiaA [Gammaproteobacteria bacterium]